MDERNTRARRGNKKQQKTTLVVILAAALLLIGGIVGAAIQSGRVKSVTKDLERTTEELARIQSMYDEKIAAYESEIAEKQKLLDEAGTPAPETGDEPGNADEDINASGAGSEEPEGKSGGWFGKLIIILIIVVVLISALFVAISTLTKGKGDDEDDDDYDDDDDDYDYDDEDDEE